MAFPAPGGSVLVCCNVATQAGYIRQYDQNVALIREQLQTMYQSGQRRLGLAVAFLSGGDTFALDCSTGKLATQDRANLLALLEDAIAAGFEEFVLEIIPEWEMSYQNWQKPDIMGATPPRPFQPLIYGQMLSFIVDAWEAAKAACAGRANVYLDPLGECASTEVGSRLWSDLCALYPDPNDPATLLGFSHVPTQATLDAIPRMYANGKRPRVWNVHPYNNTGADNAEMTWQHYKAKLAALYPNDGFIIGEISTDDPKSAAAIALDISGLFWLLQWPVLSGTTPDGTSQDRLTLTFNAYRQFGVITS